MLDFDNVEGEAHELWAIWVMLCNVELEGGPNKPVICPALCSTHGFGDENIPNISLTDNDIIYQRDRGHNNPPIKTDVILYITATPSPNWAGK